AYTRKVAWAVPEYEGFRFTCPFDGSPVVWYPIRVAEREIRSNTKGESYKLKTYAPVGVLNADGRAPMNRYKLQQQLAPMLVDAMDSAASGFVNEKLTAAGVKSRVALFDSWLVPEHDLPKLDQAIIAAGEPWLRSLTTIYDALLAYHVPKKDRAWMEERAQV